MDFPFWFKPRQDVPGILIASDDEWKDVTAMGWPDVQCPLPGQVEVVVDKADK